MSLQQPSLLKAFGTCLSGAAMALLFVLALATVSHFVPRQPVVAHIRSSIPLMNMFRRSDTFTECMVMASAALPASLAADLFDFQTLLGLPPESAVPHDHETCASLRPFVLGQKTADEIGTTSYAHYWNGPVSLVRLLLAAMPFLPAYILLALGFAGALAWWGLGLARAGLSARRAGWIAFACFYGGAVPFYAGNLAHTPSFLIPLALMGACLSSPSLRPQTFAAWARLTGAVAALTFYFDMLFMAIPFNAILLGISYLALNKKASFRDIFILLGLFALAGIGVFALKLAIYSLWIAPAYHSDLFLQDLVARFVAADDKGESFTFWDLVLRTANPASKMFGHKIILLTAHIAGLVGLIAAWRADHRRGAAFALIAMIEPVWMALFQNHTWIHGTFTMRIFFCLPLLGFLAWEDTPNGHKTFAAFVARFKPRKK